MLINKGPNKHSEYKRVIARNGSMYVSYFIVMRNLICGSLEELIAEAEVTIQFRGYLVCAMDSGNEKVGDPKGSKKNSLLRGHVLTGNEC